MPDSVSQVPVYHILKAVLQVTNGWAGYALRWNLAALDKELQAFIQYTRRILADRIKLLGGKLFAFRDDLVHRPELSHIISFLGVEIFQCIIDVYRQQERVPDLFHLIPEIQVVDGSFRQRKPELKLGKTVSF
jgi:hypothetical protein